MPTKKDIKNDHESNVKEQVTKAFLEHLLSQYTPVQVQVDLFMKPVSEVIGRLKCTVYRNN